MLRFHTKNSTACDGTLPKHFQQLAAGGSSGKWKKCGLAYKTWVNAGLRLQKNKMAAMFAVLVVSGVQPKDSLKNLMRRASKSGILVVIHWLHRARGGTAADGNIQTCPVSHLATVKDHTSSHCSHLGATHGGLKDKTDCVWSSCISSTSLHFLKLSSILNLDAHAHLVFLMCWELMF